MSFTSFKHTVLLGFIVLAATLLFIKAPLAHAQATPTVFFYCGGSNFCVPSDQPTPTVVNNDIVTPGAGTTVPTETALEPSPTVVDPCDQTISAAAKRGGRHHRGGGLMNLLLEFLLQLLNKIFELLGMQPLPTQPTQPTEPSPTAADPTPSGDIPTTEPTSPAPTTAPCPTGVPSGTTAPTTTTAPVTAAPTVGTTTIYLGAAIEPNQLDDSAFTGALKTYKFNSLTPENVMKFDRLEPSQGQFTFDEADKLVNYAQANNMRVRGHALVWGRNNVPGWLTGLSNEQASAAVKNHITTVVGRYKGKIAQWDVVNEAFNDDGSVDGGPFKEKMGADFMALAFQWAHEADPNAVLFYNDFSAEGVGAKADAVYNLVKDFKARGIPISGVGLQTHADLGYPGTKEEIAGNIKRLRDLGVQVEITELDVRGSGQEQADRYGAIGAACKESGCSGITTWGLYDGHTWLSGQNPLLLDTNFNKKPAYDSLMKAIGQ